ncbi:hypothetical protein Tco_0010671 [Tanacetum coccineum]
MQLNDLMVLCTKLQAQVLNLEKAKDAQAKEISCFEEEDLEGRSIEDIDADAEVTLVNETQERQDDDLILQLLDGFGDMLSPTIPTTIEETLAHTLMEIKAAKPKAKGIVFHDQEEQVSVLKAPQIAVTKPSVTGQRENYHSRTREPLTKKDQVQILQDEDLARNIKAQLDAEIIE